METINNTMSLKTLQMNNEEKYSLSAVKSRVADMVAWVDLSTQAEVIEAACAAKPSNHKNFLLVQANAATAARAVVEVLTKNCHLKVMVLGAIAPKIGHIFNKYIGGDFSEVDSAYVGGILLSMLNGHTHSLKKAMASNGHMEWIVEYSGPAKVVAALKAASALMPMVVEPLPHSEEREGGWLLAKSPLVGGSRFNTERSHSVICYGAINKGQSVAFEVNKEVAKVYATIDRDYNHPHNGEEYAKAMELALDVGRFYLPMKFDFRGRMYYQGTYLNPQGDSMKKAMISLHKKEVITALGAKYLKEALVDANKGVKKAQKKLSANKKPQNKAKLTYKVEGAKAMAMSYDLAWQDYLDGVPSGIIVHRDASNSGLQMYSILTADAVMGKACNLMESEEAQDAYGLVAEILNTHYKQEIFNRDHVKYSFMTYLYMAGKKVVVFGSTEGDYTGYIAQGMLEAGLPIVEDELYVAFNRAMILVAPRAAMVMKELAKLFKDLAEATVSWTSPSGFKCVQHSVQTVEKAIRIGEHFSFTVHHQQVAFDSKSVSLAPNIIHSVDASVVHHMIADSHFDMVVIHDSFGCHPNNAASMEEMYRKCLAEILEAPVLTHIKQDLYGLERGYEDHTPRGDLRREDILNSKFAIGA